VNLQAQSSGDAVDLFLCGDVMTGRGIDQILPHPSEPTIYEPFVTSAGTYVGLCEAVSGPVPRSVDFAYIWGDALAEINSRAPDVRLINLETSVTGSSMPVPKGINYRMHPANLPCLLAAGIDCCAMANNHVLDWGVPGLLETLDTLREAGIAVAGAGRTAEGAARPAALETKGKPRVVVAGMGSPTSGIPSDWAATSTHPGVNVIPDLSEEAAVCVADQISQHTRAGDLVIASIHWGDNWGYDIPETQRRFAHRLIDSGAVDVVHGHSSHHAKGIEVYAGHLVLYGCGDFINDYEGIGGYEEFEPRLVVAYFVALDRHSGRLLRLEMVPFRQQRFRLQRTTRRDAAWLKQALDRESRPPGDCGGAVRRPSPRSPLVTMMQVLACINMNRLQASHTHDGTKREPPEPTRKG
jgi:poly-gamma-glutamate synthesis protein (capsule biosynthesis protein)